MKVLIVSDSHGRNGNLEVVIEREQPLDMLIHLGDLECDESDIEFLAGCETKMVCGNNDFYSQLPETSVFPIENLKAFICHGHGYNVYYGTEQLETAGRNAGAEIVMFGHTHHPYIEKKENFVILNPGSISYPRQEGRQASYIVMNFEKKIKKNFEVNFEIKYV